jgi:hypothetical protein
MIGLQKNAHASSRNPSLASARSSIQNRNGRSQMLSVSLRRSLGLSRFCGFSGSTSFGTGLPTASDGHTVRATAEH